MNKQCFYCHGKGYVFDNPSRECPHCNGSGYADGIYRTLTYDDGSAEINRRFSLLTEARYIRERYLSQKRGRS